MLSQSTLKQYLRPLEPLRTGLTPRLELRQPVKCILFDVYGTLLISASGEIGGTVENGCYPPRLPALLERYGINKTPLQLLQQLQSAIESEHHRLKSEGIEVPEIQIENIWQKILKIEDLNTVKAFALEYELIANPVYPMPHLMRLLATCRKRHVMMGIISNAQFYTPLLFEFFCNADLMDLGFHPELIFFSYQFGIAKPSKKLFTTAIERLREQGIRPCETLFLGNDMLNDMYPANRVGLLTALFAGDRRSLRQRTDNPRCRNLKPLLLVTDLNQLVALLEKQGG